MHGNALAHHAAMSPTATLDYQMIDRLRELGTAGLPDPIAAISDAFTADSATRLQKMMQAFAAGDYAAVRGVVGEFKGVSGTIGAMRLYALCREIEQTPADAERLGQFGEEVERVSGALASAATH
jgi:HPt (histidine-containing phosphotransfer) domain-containing protein